MFVPRSGVSLIPPPQNIPNPAQSIQFPFWRIGFLIFRRTKFIDQHVEKVC
jgi:hypothetical protein